MTGLHNVFIDARTAADIDARVARILRDIGDPEPPLRLEIVRDLLSLDRGYYSKTDSGVLQETVHRLTLAGQQVIRRPSLLLDVVLKLDIKALWLPDRKRILIDKELPTPKQRWGEAHEIGHSILPWHEMMLHGDMKRTLSFTCEERIEAEANFAAGRLIFLQEAFTERVHASPLSFQRVRDLSSEFGNTMTSTLWRIVESFANPAFGLVSQHPKHPVVEGSPPIRYFVRSPVFASQFGNLTSDQLFAKLGTFCFGKRGPIGSAEVTLADSNGVSHIFFVESFFNHHDTLSLGSYRGVRSPQIAVSRR